MNAKTISFDICEFAEFIAVLALSFDPVSLRWTISRSGDRVCFYVTHMGFDYEVHFLADRTVVRVPCGCGSEWIETPIHAPAWVVDALVEHNRKERVSALLLDGVRSLVDVAPAGKSEAYRCTWWVSRLQMYILRSSEDETVKMDALRRISRHA